MYSITELSKLSGVSTRTLRYYEDEGLLKAVRDKANGYRHYTSKEVDRLQHILILRALGLSIKEIKAILSKGQDEVKMLESHLSALQDEAKRIETLIKTVELTIESKTRGVIMNDEEKFKAFKKSKIEENENKYGKEARDSYGDRAVDEANDKYMGLSKEDFDMSDALATEIKDLIIQGVSQGDEEGAIGRSLAEKHKAWLMFFWKSYTREAHVGLAEMYLADERFKAHYDAYINEGCRFLVNSIKKYA